MAASDYILLRGGIKIPRHNMDDESWAEAIRRTKRAGTFVRQSGDVSVDIGDPKIEARNGVRDVDPNDAPPPREDPEAVTWSMTKALDKLDETPGDVKTAPDQFVSFKGGKVYRRNMTDRQWQQTLNDVSAEDPNATQGTDRRGAPPPKGPETFTFKSVDGSDKTIARSPDMSDEQWSQLQDMASNGHGPGVLDKAVDAVGGALGTARDAVNDAGSWVKENVIGNPVDLAGMAKDAGKTLINPLAPVDGYIAIKNAVDPNGAARAAADYDARLAATGQPAPGGVPAAAQPQLAAPAPGAAPGSASVTASGARFRDPVSGIPNQDKEIAAAFKKEQDAQTKLAEIQSQGLQKQSELALEQQKTIMEHQAIQQKAAAAQQAEMKALEDNYKSVQKQMQDTSKTIDPNRLYNSMNTGQKVLAGLSVFFGGIGAGTKAALGMSTRNEALDRMQEAVKQDIEVQKTNYENKRQGLKDQLGGIQSMYGMLRERGASIAEAEKLAMSLHLEGIQKQMDAYAKQTGSAAAMQEAQAASAKLEQEKIKMQLGAAKEREHTAIERGKLEVERGLLAVKARAAAQKAASKEQSLKGPQVINEADLRAGLKQIDELEAAYNKVPKVAGRVGKHIPGTDSQDYDNKRAAAFEMISPILNKGTLRDDDVPRWNARYPQAGEMGGHSKFEALRSALKQRYAEHQRGLDAAKFHSGSAPDADEPDGNDFEPD